MPDATDDFEHGPYPREWDEPTRDLWDTEPNTYRELYSAEEWGQLQEAFHYGWVHDQSGHDRDYYDYYREQFYDITGIDPSGFDWESWREYLGY